MHFTYSHMPHQPLSWCSYIIVCCGYVYAYILECMTNYIPYKVITPYLITALSKHCIYVGKINYTIHVFVNIVHILAWLQPPTPTHTSGGAPLLHGQARPPLFCSLCT